MDANTASARSGTVTLSLADGSSLPFTVFEAASSAIPPVTTTSTCAATCTLSSPGQPISASGGPGSVTVTATSSWTVVVVHTWIHVTSSSSNNGNGMVNFTVDANTGPVRTGTISVASQTYTIAQNGTPTGTTAGCSYLIQSNTTQTAGAAGTSNGFIQVVTAQTCAWAATTAYSAWITIQSGAIGTGNGAVSYKVAANTGAARCGSIVVAGQNVVVNQDAAPVAPVPGTPAVAAAGVVNTANYAPGGPPNGSLAQGSFFSIYGSDLGPANFVQATSYPLPTALGGVAVKVNAGGGSYDAYLVFASKGQINAVLPSTVPTGSAQVVVTYNSKSSDPVAITVARTSLGLFYQPIGGKNFAIAQNVNSATDYPLNLPAVPAKPGQIVILWGTGLGPIGTADNISPGGGDMPSVPVTIQVGGVAAPRIYAGRQPQTAAVDNVYFTVPANAPLGCQVPVVVSAGGIAANTVNIAISADGSQCSSSDPSWQKLTTSTIGPSGGTLSATGVQVTFPARSLAATADLTLSVLSQANLTGGVVTKFYQIDGLPEPQADGIVIALDAAANVPEGLVFLVMKPDNDPGGPLIVPAQVSGGKIRATLPAVRGTASPEFGTASPEFSTASPEFTEGGRLAGDRTLPRPPWNTKYSFWALAGLWDHKSASGDFNILAPVGSDSARGALERGLDAGKRLIVQMGFDWGQRGDAPMSVYLFSYSSWSSVLLGGSSGDNGNSETFIWGKNNVGLCVNLDFLAKLDSTALEELRITDAHEMLHVIQNAYGSDSSWLWYDEATATWLERAASTDADYVSGIVKDNSSFLLTQLMAPVPRLGLFNRVTVQKYGYGAALFLQYMAPATSGDASAGTALSIPYASLLSTPPNFKGAVAALDSAAMNRQWLDFCVKYFNGAAMTDTPNTTDLAINWPNTVAYAAPQIQLTPNWAANFPGSETFKAALPGYYAGALYAVTFDSANLKVGDQLTFTLSGAAGSSEAVVGRRTGHRSVLTPLQTVTGTWTMTVDDQLAKDALIILVAIGRSRNTVTLTISTGSQTVPGPLTATDTFIGSVKGDMAWSSGLKVLDFGFSSGLHAVRWTSATTFQGNYQFDDSGTSDSYHVATTSYGTVSANGAVLLELTCHVVITSKTATGSSVETTDVYLRNIPQRGSAGSFSYNPSDATPTVSVARTHSSTSSYGTTQETLKVSSITSLDVKFTKE